MNDKITQSYNKSKDIYDDIITHSKWWSKLYIKLFWSGVDDNEIARELMKEIPDDFSGKLLDIPVGTAVFTYRKYKTLKDADITCVDYSEDMLERTRVRFRENEILHASVMQGDVGNLPFADETFDIVLSMNGFHVFPEKEKAFEETYRVLKAGGSLIACFYVEGESKISDTLAKKVLAKKGWFTPPFDTYKSLRKRLEEHYTLKKYKLKGSVVSFCAVKK